MRCSPRLKPTGKITDAQAAKIESVWMAYHTDLVKAKILQRILGVKSEATLNAFLTKAEAAGKITAAQAAKIQTLWETVHGS